MLAQPFARCSLPGLLRPRAVATSVGGEVYRNCDPGQALCVEVLGRGAAKFGGQSRRGTYSVCRAMVLPACSGAARGSVGDIGVLQQSFLAHHLHSEIVGH